MKTWRSFRPFLFMLMAVVAWSGCVDFGVFREFTNRAADTSHFDELATHYLEHHERLKYYREPKHHEALNKLAADRQKQERALLGLHRGFAEYLNALGALASDEIVSYDKAMDGFASELQNSKLATDSQADAFASLSKFIAKAATDGFRRRKLKQFIQDANEPFQNVVGALTNIVGKHFERDLNSEISEVDGYYEELIADAKEKGTPLATIEFVKERQFAKRRELQQRKEACLLYIENVAAIASAHQMLFDRREELRSRETLNALYSYGQEIKALQKKMRHKPLEGFTP